MTLLEMSVEYRKSGEICRNRIREVSCELDNSQISAAERLIQKRRLTVLHAMMRDSLETAKKLENYYPRRRTS